MSDQLSRVHKFLLGEKSLLGSWFDESAPFGHVGRYWWRTLLVKAIEAEKLKKSRACKWKEDEWIDAWETQCGHLYQIIDGTPSENKMKFCCYCGGKLVEASDEA